jgi:hypothetical protein
MIYHRDFCDAFEKICGELDLIIIFGVNPSLRSRTIQFHQLLNQLKLVLAQSYKIVNKFEINNFKRAITKYEADFEILKALNIENVISLDGNYIYVIYFIKLNNTGNSCKSGMGKPGLLIKLFDVWNGYRARV